MHYGQILGHAAALIVLALALTSCSREAGAGDQTSTLAGVEYQEGYFKGDALIPPRPAPPFELKDMDGTTVTPKALQGKVVLLGFAFTDCADVCPLLAQSFAAVQQSLGERVGRDVELVFISQDPEGDTIEARKAWTGIHAGHWRYLNGESSQLQQVWDAYKVHVVTDAHGEIAHGVKTYVIDRNGLLRVRYGGLLVPSAVVTDIQTLLELG